MPRHLKSRLIQNYSANKFTTSFKYKLKSYFYSLTGQKSINTAESYINDISDAANPSIISSVKKNNNPTSKQKRCFD